MNHIYRLVWNKKRHMLMAVAEVAGAHGKDTAGDAATESAPAAPGKAGGRIGARTAIAAAVMALFPLVSYAQSPCVVGTGQTLQLSDSDGSNASVASCSLYNDGTVDISATDNGTSTLGLSGSGTVLTGERNLTVTDAHDFYAGTIQGAGGFTVGAGLQVLDGSNTYHGATVIGAPATLALSGSGSIALSSAIVNDGWFDISDTNQGAEVRGLGGSGMVMLGEQTLTLTNASNQVFSGAIMGQGGLTVAGGAAILDGFNSYQGATAIREGASLTLSNSGGIAMSSGLENDGTLSLRNLTRDTQLASLSGSGSVLLGGGNLVLTNASGNFSGNMQDMGGLVVASGVQVLSGANDYSGMTAVEAGATLSLSGSGSIASSYRVVNDGTLDIASANQGAQVRSLSGSGAVLLGGQTLTLTNAYDTFAGVVQGAGGLTVAGGFQTLAGANTYSGATAVERLGRLSLSGSGSIALSSGLDNDGYFDIASTDAGAQLQSISGSGSVYLGDRTLTLTNAKDTFAGSMAGNGGLTVAGGHAVLSGANSYYGATVVEAAGQLSLSGSGSIAMSKGLLNEGVFDIAAANQGAKLGSLSGSGTVLLGGQTLTLTNARDTFAGAIHGSGGLAITGGAEVLSGRNTYTGATTVGQYARLELAGAGSIASSDVLVNGILDVSASASGVRFESLGGSGSVLLGGQTLTLSDAAGAFDGRISGSGGLAIAGGVLTLTNVQSYTGATSIGHGATLALGAKGRIFNSAVHNEGVFDISGYDDPTLLGSTISIKNLSGSGTVLLGSTDLTLSAADGGFAGTLVGSGDVNIMGGKFALGGANLNTGKVTVSNGALRTTSIKNLGMGTQALGLYSATWHTGADLTHEHGLELSVTGTVDVDAGTTTTENGKVTGLGAFVKQGQGTLVLRGVLANSNGLKVQRGALALDAANTYLGNTTVSTGATLRIAGDASLGDAENRLVLDGGALQTASTMELARAITLTANNGIVDTLGADSVVTLNGNIDGAGRLVKEGAGTLVLAGDNGGGKGSANQPGDGWTGGLTVNDGLVKVTHAYGLGWGSVLTFNGGTVQAMVDIATGQDIRLGNSSTIHTDADTVTTLAGDLLSTGGGDGCFTKTGLGTLNVTGKASIDATCVVQGKLLANGTFDSKITVARGATLGGAGTIKGDLLVKGTLSPGNSPGMLTADANVTMATGSTYKQDIGGSVQASGATPVGAAGYYSYLHVVNGKRFVIEPGATLAPALKNLYTPDEAGYGAAPLVPQLGQTFRIVTADGGIVGRFDTLAQPDGLASGTRMAAFYDAGGNDSIELKVLPASYASWYANGGGNANGRSVAAALDRIAELDASGQSSARQNGLLYQAGSYDAAQLGRLVRGLAGEVHGALAAAAPQAGWDLQRSVLKHGAADDARALWLDITANRGEWSGDDGAAGFHADRVQATVGLDVLRAAGSRIGVGFSHARSDLSADDGSGKLRQNKLFVYGETAAAGLAFDAIGSVGRDKTESGRADPFAPGAVLATRGEGDSALLGLGVRAQREFRGASIEPFAWVTLQKIERDRADEGAASMAALALDDHSATGTRLVTGLSAASRNTDPLQASTYRFNLGVGVDGGDLLRPAQGAALAGTGFTIGAPEAGRVFVQGGVTGTLQLKKGAYLYFGVNGEARSGYYQAGGNAGVRAVF